MKKVLIFSIAYTPYLGGAELAIENITDRIDPKEIEFHMITPRFNSALPKVERLGNVLVHRIGFTKKDPSMKDLVSLPLKLNKFLFPFTASAYARKLHKKEHYDGIWAMMANFAGFAALFFKKRHPEVPYLLSLQEGDPIESIKKKVRLVYGWFQEIFQSADFVQVISTYLGDFAREMGYKGPLERVPNAVDAKKFTKLFNEEEKMILKKKLNKQKKDVFIVTMSRLVLKNAIDDVIRALKHLPGHIKFVVLGNGPDEKKLKKLARNIGVEERVIFLGFVENSDVPKFLAVSDIFIRPSLSEGMGNSFVEAMAAGVPVIATPVGGIVDFLFDSHRSVDFQKGFGASGLYQLIDKPSNKPTGVFCNVRDPESIAQSVNLILEDNQLRENIVKNAKELAVKEYNWNLIARRMQNDVFRSLLRP